MSNVYEMFDTDRSAEETGIWLNFGSFKFKVARAGGANKRFQKLITRRLEPHQRAIQAGLMDEGLAQKILAESFADAVILDWDGVTDRAGQPIAYTRDACVKLLLELPDLFEEIREQATKTANFRQAAREADARD